MKNNKHVNNNKKR